MGGSEPASAAAASAGSMKPHVDAAAAFTSSVSFKPVPPTAPLGAVPGADEFVLELRVPGVQTADVRLLARDGLDGVMARIAAATGARSVALVCNGDAVTADVAAERRLTVAALFGAAVEVSLDGVRYNVNRGLRLSPTGAAAKRTLVVSYAYAVAGAALLLGGCLAFWSVVVPREHQRWGQPEENAGAAAPAAATTRS